MRRQLWDPLADKGKRLLLVHVPVEDVLSEICQCYNSALNALLLPYERLLHEQIIYIVKSFKPKLKLGYNTHQFKLLKARLIKTNKYYLQ